MGAYATPGAQGVKYSLAPGMQVSGEVHLETRTLLVTKAFHEAARER